MGASGTGVKMTTPSLLHAPPAPTGARASTWSEPPSTPMRLMRSLEKNPMDSLSGDQNGNDAPSVPASGRATPDLNDRTQSCGRPSVDATKATFSPSGDNAIDT